MKNKILKISSIFVVLLFLISGVSSALNIEIKDDNADKEQSNCFIDPNIKLNCFHLNFLKKSLNNIKDLKIKDLVNNVIEGIKKDGVVDSEELSDIVVKCDLSSSIRGIHSGFISGSCPCRDSFIALPGFLRVLLMSFITMTGDWARFFGYSTYVYWQSQKWDYHGCSIKVNNIHKYPKGHTGNIIGFIGQTSHLMTAFGTSHIPCDPVFKIKGIGALIIIS